MSAALSYQLSAFLACSIWMEASKLENTMNKLKAES